MNYEKEYNFVVNFLNKLNIQTTLFNIDEDEAPKFDLGLRETIYDKDIYKKFFSSFPSTVKENRNTCSSNRNGNRACLKAKLRADHPDYEKPEGKPVSSLSSLWRFQSFPVYETGNFKRSSNSSIFL